MPRERGPPRRPAGWMRCGVSTSLLVFWPARAGIFSRRQIPDPFSLSPQLRWAPRAAGLSTSHPSPTALRSGLGHHPTVQRFRRGRSAVQGMEIERFRRRTPPHQALKSRRRRCRPAPRRPRVKVPLSMRRSNLALQAMQIERPRLERPRLPPRAPLRIRRSAPPRRMFWPARRRPRMKVRLRRLSRVCRRSRRFASSWMWRGTRWAAPAARRTYNRRWRQPD